MNEAEARRRIETLELAANRVVTAASLLTVAQAAGLDARELELEVDRVLALTSDYSPAERIQWLSRDTGVPVDTLRQGAAAILAECRDA